MKKSKEKSLEFSIDRLSLIGEFKYKDFVFQVENYLNNNEFSTRLRLADAFFKYSYNLEGFGLVQFDLDSLKMRFDFNPNKITEDGKKFFNFLISFITDIHYTRLDLAIDLFNYDISSYNIIDIGSRKNAYFYDRVGKLETFYSGSMKSNKYIRIYNKAVEQKLDKNIDWWRFEIQLRDVYIDKYLNELIEFYKDILVFKYNSVDYYSFEENAILDYLLHDISRFEKLSKNQKTKYRKIIRSLELSSLDFFDTILSLTNKKIYDFLNFISFNNLYPEINSKIHLEYFE